MNATIYKISQITSSNYKLLNSTLAITYSPKAGHNYLQHSKLAVTSGTFRYTRLLALSAHYTINMISLDIMRVNNCYTSILHIETKALNNTADTD